ncbi:unnamed protein product [Linum trigynum]|uniref:Uncharacterized protein n=1 Tax=Linum trigynum TaxID=586398 RepID=A0AAV2CRD0_9ROSI
MSDFVPSIGSVIEANAGLVPGRQATTSAPLATTLSLPILQEFVPVIEEETTPTRRRSKPQKKVELVEIKIEAALSCHELEVSLVPSVASDGLIVVEANVDDVPAIRLKGGRRSYRRKKRKKRREVMVKRLGSLTESLEAEDEDEVVFLKDPPSALPLLPGAHVLLDRAARKDYEESSMVTTTQCKAAIDVATMDSSSPQLRSNGGYDTEARSSLRGVPYGPLRHGLVPGPGCIGPRMGGLTGALLYGIGSLGSEVCIQSTRKVAACDGTKAILRHKYGSSDFWQSCEERNTIDEHNGTLGLRGVRGEDHVEVQDVEWGFGFTCDLQGWHENNICMTRAYSYAPVRGLHGKWPLKDEHYWWQAISCTKRRN